VTLGLLPGAGGTQRLPRVVGQSRAAEAILLGQRIDAATAHAWGLVNRVVDPGGLDGAVDEIVSGLLRLAGPAVTRVKRCLLASRSPGLHDGLGVELEQFLDAVPSPEAGAGTSAFLAQRRR
jgi:enoyl-CoA hydratase/carnithine racemase